MRSITLLERQQGITTVTSQAAYEIQENSIRGAASKLHSPHEASKLETIYQVMVLLCHYLKLPTKQGCMEILKLPHAAGVYGNFKAAPYGRSVWKF